MPGLRLLANMNISPDTVDALEGQGWDIIRVPQILPINAPDLEVLQYARREEMVLITQDLDFSSPPSRNAGQRMCSHN